ncbi:MAG: nitrite reductase, copper-containing, partial [Halobacteriaceae archaeon]
MFDQTRRKLMQALGIGGTAALAGCNAPTASPEQTKTSITQQKNAAKQVDVDRVAADPTDIPDPIDRNEPKHHDITLTVKEHVAEIEDGITFSFMTFNGQIPG